VPRPRKTPAMSLEPKREPRQARSREMVRRLLEAALAVLKRDGVEGFTANHVAAEAGVSVASLYQFFPNKHAIIYRLYQDWLDEVSRRLVAVAEPLLDVLDWREFALRLSKQLAESVVDPRAEYELLRAMWSHRDLLELDRRHSEALGERVADYMVRFGARRPRAELVRIASFANELHSLAAERAPGDLAVHKRALDDLAHTGYVALWQRAMTTTTPRGKVASHGAARGGRSRRRAGASSGS